MPEKIKLYVGVTLYTHLLFCYHLSKYLFNTIMRYILINLVLHTSYNGWINIYIYIYIYIYFFFFWHQKVCTDSCRLCKPKWQLCIHVYDERRLYPSTACQGIRHCILRPRNMNDFRVGETFSQRLNILQVTFKCWSFLWFRNHLHQLRIICCKQKVNGFFLGEWSLL